MFFLYTNKTQLNYVYNQTFDKCGHGHDLSCTTKKNYIYFDKVIISHNQIRENFGLNLFYLILNYQIERFWTQYTC